MSKPSAKPIRRPEHHPAGERRRWNVLVAGAILLLLSFPLILFNVSSKALISIAFLLPALQSGCALSGFDEIRSFRLVVERSLLLELFSLLSPMPMFILTSFAEPPLEIWSLVSCVYMIWGFSFELGLGCASKLWHFSVYTVMSLSFGLRIPRSLGTEMSLAIWALGLTPALLIFLLLNIGILYGETMFLADPTAEEVEIVAESGGASLNQDST